MDACSSIWPAQLGENRAMSCVFMWVSKWDRVPLSGGHGSGPGQKPLPVSGPRITQDDLFKGSKEKEMCVFCRQLFVYFSLDK